MDYELRIATKLDEARINELFIEMLNTIYNTSDSIGYEEGSLDRYFTDSEDVIFVAYKDSVVFAFISVEVYKDEDSLYLDDFSVSKEYRSLGIGTKLIKRVEEYSKEIGISKIELHVEKSNIKALSLYKSLGYSESKDEGNRLLMEKRI